MNYSIFDVDGTILDSMEVWNTLASRYVQSLGMIPQNNLDEIVSNMSLEQSAITVLVTTRVGCVHSFFP